MSEPCRRRQSALRRRRRTGRSASRPFPNITLHKQGRRDARCSADHAPTVAGAGTDRSMEPRRASQARRFMKSTTARRGSRTCGPAEERGLAVAREPQEVVRHCTAHHRAITRQGRVVTRHQPRADQVGADHEADHHAHPCNGFSHASDFDRRPATSCWNLGATWKAQP